MRKYLIFGLCFLLLAIPIHAKEVIDLQDYTACDIYGYCKTEVDINELPLTKGGKDLLKSIESDTVYSLETSHSIESFSIEIKDKEKLIITGHITQSTYWTADLGEVLIDPWWNYTTDCFNSTLSNKTVTTLSQTGATDDHWFGYNLTVKNTGKIGIQLGAGCGCDKAVILESDETTLETIDVNDDGVIYNFTVVLNTSDWYILACGSTSGTRKCSPYPEGNYPFQNEDVYLKHRATNESASWVVGSTDSADNIQMVYYRNEVECGTVNTWYVNSLTLNGTASNLTMANSTALNSTAITNLTGAYAIIYINDTVSANGTDSSTNTTYLNSGLWNVTGWFGNASTNETITWWATISAVPPPVPNYTYAICTDDDTLFHHLTNSMNGSFYYNDTYTLCMNGCDNVSFSCEPLEYEQSIFNIALVIAFIIGTVILYRWKR